MKKISIHNLELQNTFAVSLKVLNNKKKILDQLLKYVEPHFFCHKK